MKSLLNPLVEVFELMYPNLCLVCGAKLMRNESHVCLECLNDIPKTNFHLQPDNSLEKRFWGKVPIHSATAFFFFQKGSPFQKILHSLKYDGNYEVGEMLGAYAAVDLKNESSFSSIDYILPVPLHPRRYLERTYNQSEAICKGLASQLHKPVRTEHIQRVRENATQTRKSVYERYENTAGIFKLANPESLVGKHVLLVDDVVTTGSTLEACVRELQQVESLTVSVFALAMAR